jgi:hypothetical protein
VIDNVFIESLQLVSGAVNQGLFHNGGDEPWDTAGTFKYQFTGWWSKQIFIPGSGGGSNRSLPGKTGIGAGIDTGSVFQHLNDEVPRFLA